MTDEEKEIRAIERKIMAKTLAVKRKISKKLNSMTLEERMEYNRKQAEEYKALGFNVVEPVTNSD